MKHAIPTPLLAPALAVLMALAAGPAGAAGQYDTGASDSAIKIGQTYPYSGPGSGAAAGARAMAGYFAMLNDHGGINGRKIDFVSLDDGYSSAQDGQSKRGAWWSKTGCSLIRLARNADQRSRPALSQQQESAAAFPRHRRQLRRRSAEIPLDHGRDPELRGRRAHLREISPSPKSRTRKSASSIRTSDFGRDHLDAFLGQLGERAATMVVRQGVLSDHRSDSDLADDLAEKLGRGYRLSHHARTPRADVGKRGSRARVGSACAAADGRYLERHHRSREQRRAERRDLRRLRKGPEQSGAGGRPGGQGLPRLDEEIHAPGRLGEAINPHHRGTTWGR